jgi:hypothetical protein
VAGVQTPGARVFEARVRQAMGRGMAQLAQHDLKLRIV